MKNYSQLLNLWLGVLCKLLLVLFLKHITLLLHSWNWRMNIKNYYFVINTLRKILDLINVLFYWLIGKKNFELFIFFFNNSSIKNFYR